MILQATLLSNLVALSNNVGKISEAMTYATEAEKNANEIGIIDLIVQSKFNLCSVNRRLGNMKTAVIFGEEALPNLL